MSKVTFVNSNTNEVLLIYDPHISDRENQVTKELLEYEKNVPVSYEVIETEATNE